MNAIEFVKDCGIDVAKRTLNNAVGMGCSEIDLIHGKYVFRTENLKQIVDAFELVDSYGGEKAARRHQIHRSAFGLYSLRKLNDALKLVEQCNG